MKQQRCEHQTTQCEISKWMVQTYFSMGGMTLCKWKNTLEFYFRNRNGAGRERLESKEASEIFVLKGIAKPHDTLILMKITML